MTLKVNIHIQLFLNEQNAQYTVKSVSVFLCAVTILIFQIKRIISREKWFNFVVTFFFFENAKNLGWSDDAKRRKKRPHGQTLLWTQSVCINGVSILSGSYYLSQKTPFFLSKILK